MITCVTYDTVPVIMRGPRRRPLRHGLTEHGLVIRTNAIGENGNHREGTGTTIYPQEDPGEAAQALLNMWRILNAVDRDGHYIDPRLLALGGMTVQHLSQYSPAESVVFTAAAQTHRTESFGSIAVSGQLAKLRGGHFRYTEEQLQPRKLPPEEVGMALQLMRMEIKTRLRADAAPDLG